MSRPRAIFFGTPEIAIPSLEALLEIADVTAVICQPDRPQGRGLLTSPPAVKTRALSLGLPVWQPTKLRTGELAQRMREERPDFAVVLAYGRILPLDVLAAPSQGCLNLHASLLPAYRGAAPITWAVVAGERRTGVSLMQMDEGLDTGPVFCARSLDIGPRETAGELAARLAQLAGEVVREDIPRALAGALRAEPQDPERATHARILQKVDGAVLWDAPVEVVFNHVRGMSPWPGAFTHLPPLREGDARRSFRVLTAEPTSFETRDATPGTVLVADPTRVLVACGDRCLQIVRGQLEGRKPLLARELVAGRTVLQGQVLG